MARNICSFEGCGKFVHGHGLCAGHGTQRARGVALAPLSDRIRKPCRFPGCGRPSNAKGLCLSHRLHERKGQELRAVRIPGVVRPLMPAPGMLGAVLVPLTRGYSAIIDENDAIAVGQFIWYVATYRTSKTQYARRSTRRSDGGRSHESLHRFLWRLWALPDVPEIDHRNLNGLDCRRKNLRAADAHGNNCNKAKQRNNTSGHKGVSWSAANRKWAAAIRVGRKSKHLGFYSEVTDAAGAYARAAKELHGEFARVA